MSDAAKADRPTPERPDPEQTEAAGASARLPRGIRSVLGGIAGSLRGLGRDAAAVVKGRLLGPAADAEAVAGDEQDTAADDPPETPSARRNEWRINVLHGVTERLRGAADQYIAAKLDEIEARVDDKLDHIEQRIDRKLLDLHEQLRTLRDQELRHRLRLLKVTLIFTVLVALLSLGYKVLDGLLAG